MTVIAVVNHKGGVGKTTTALNIARMLWDHQGDAGRIVLVDLDPQANLTTRAGGRATEPSVSDLLLGSATYSDIVQSVEVDGAPLELIPAHSELETGGIVIATKLLGYTTLRRVLADINATVLIDCPPSLGILTANAITAADYVIIPVTPEPNSITGAIKTIGLVYVLRNAHATNATIMGTIATFVNDRTNGHKAGIKEVEALGVPLLGIVPQRQGVYAEDQTREFYRIIVNGMMAGEVV